jgi:hypothetical protein
MKPTFLNKSSGNITFLLPTYYYKRIRANAIKKIQILTIRNSASHTAKTEWSVNRHIHQLRDESPNLEYDK